MLSPSSQTRLTPPQRCVLLQLRDAEYPDNEIVCDKLECWIGNRRTSWRLVNALLCMMALRDDTGADVGARRFSINESGRHVLADESNIQRITAAALRGGAWTWKQGRLIELSSPA